MAAPTLTKRLYDQRLLTLDVHPKLRDGDTVTEFTSVSVAASDPSDAEALNVSVDASAPITDGSELNFRCTGGQSGAEYRVILRYVAATETRLESVLNVKVV